MHVTTILPEAIRASQERVLRNSSTLLHHTPEQDFVSAGRQLQSSLWKSYHKNSSNFRDHKNQQMAFTQKDTLKKIPLRSTVLNLWWETWLYPIGEKCSQTAFFLRSVGHKGIDRTTFGWPLHVFSCIFIHLRKKQMILLGGLNAEGEIWFHRMHRILQSASANPIQTFCSFSEFLNLKNLIYLSIEISTAKHFAKILHTLLLQSAKFGLLRIETVADSLSL